MDEDEEPMYTVNEMAHILHVKVKTIYRLIERKNFPAISIGGRLRVQRKAFWAWVNENQKQHAQKEQQREKEGVGCY